MDTSSNVLDIAPKTFLSDWRVWTMVIIALTSAVLFYMNYTAWTSSPWFSERYQEGVGLLDWLPRWMRKDDLSNNIVSLEPAPSAKPAEPKPETPREAAAERETWCLVAEDFAGRYCVKVPGPKSCTHERSYLSQDQCTLTPGMHLPAGPVKNGGVAMEMLSTRGTQ